MKVVSTTHQPAAQLFYRWPPHSTTIREGALHLCLFLAVLIATLIGYNAPTTIVIGAEETSSRILTNFYEVEYTDGLPFRWTRGESTICLPQVGYTDRSALRVTLLGEGANALGIQDVTFLVNGRPITTVPVKPAVQHYDLLLSGQELGQGDLCVSIVSATSQTDIDRRLFGVPFNELIFYRTTNIALVLPATLQLFLNLGLALLLFWSLRLLGLRTGWTLLLVALPALLLGVGVGAGTISPDMDATRNLLPLVGLAALLFVSLGTVRLANYTALSTRFARLVRLPANLSRDLLAMALWSLVLYGSIWIIQAVYGHSGVWPLKAGVWMTFTPLVLLPIALFAAWLWVTLQLLQEDAPPHWLSLVLILGAAVLLPIVLKVAVRGWDSLYITFRDNPTDYIHDVWRIDNPVTFLGQYVELSPTLAGHNSNHPPGTVLLLWLVERTIGPGPYIASWMAILLSSLSGLAAWWLGLRLGGRHLALLAGTIYVVMPGHMAYAATSMDGVFNALNALAAVAFLLALERDATPWRAVLAGVLLTVGVFFTYATTQLFYFGLAICVLALVRPGNLRHVLRQGAIASGVLVASYLLLYLTTHFDIIAAVFQAKANNARPYTTGITDNAPDQIWLPTVAHYVRYFVLNIAAYLWYLAPWGLAALTPITVAAVRGWRRATLRDTVAIGLVVMLLGMWFSGMFIREVERLWGFTYPLAAALIATHIWQGATQREQIWRAGLWISLFFAQAVMMRLLLNLYW